MRALRVTRVKLAVAAVLGAWVAVAPKPASHLPGIPARAEPDSPPAGPALRPVLRPLHEQPAPGRPRVERPGIEHGS